MWAKIVTFAEQVEKVAKPVALVLAVFGLISLYFPGLKRGWEEFIEHAGWYEVGTFRLDEDGKTVRFSTNDYDSPAWNSGGRPELILALKGKEVLTTGIAVGRDDSNTGAQVLTVLDKNQCLHVTDLAFGNFVPGASQMAPTRLSSMSTDGGWEAQWKRILAARAGSSPPRCQALTMDESKKKFAPASKAVAGSPPPAFNASAPVCARTNIWIQAQKVSC